LEDLIWIVVAVVAGLFSIANRIKKQRQQQGGTGPSQAPPQQRWPGPVAGPKPGQGPTWSPSPGPRPGPTWAPAPGTRPGYGQAQQPAEPQPKKEAPKTLVSSDVFSRGLESEGYGTEGIGSEGVGIEGPGVGEGVEDEVYRFSRESEIMEKRELAELTDDLVRPERSAYSLAPEAVGAADLQSTLTDSAGLSRAIVLSEVLGKPKALRGRGARRF
jgi:hypothetical protein